MTETARPVCAAHVASRGPRFFRSLHGGEVMFEITLDHRSKIGPRPAAEADSLAYPAAWKTFVDAELAEEEAKADPVAPGKPLVEAVDVPEAKADAERQAADRQRKMDERRGRGL